MLLPDWWVMATDSHSSTAHPMAQTPVFLPVRAEMKNDGIKSFMKSHFTFIPNVVRYLLSLKSINLYFVFVKTNVDIMFKFNFEKSLIIHTVCALPSAHSTVFTCK